MMNWLVPRGVLNSRDWGRFPDYVAERAVVVVTGTWEGAELFDRPLAYMVASALVGRSLFPVVLSDEFLLNVGKRLSIYVEKGVSFVSIGSRVANAFTALVAGEAGVDPEEYVGVVEWRGTVVGLAYGRDPFGTRDAVYRFLTEHLDRFVEGIGEERKGIELVDWPGYAREDNSLTGMLKELMGGGQAAKAAEAEPAGTQSAGGMGLPGDVEELWRFVRERVSVVADPPGEVLQPRIVRWWRSGWAPRRLLVEYVGESDPSDPELFLEVRDECNGFLVVEAARFGATRLWLNISGYMYLFEHYDESRGHFNDVGSGYFIHYVQAPYARGAIVTGDPEEARREILGRLSLSLPMNPRQPQVVLRWKGERGKLQQLLSQLKERLNSMKLQASYRVYECSEPRVVISVVPEQ